MPTSNKPVIVLVPGAWTVPAAYRKLVQALEARSFTVHVPSLPTNNRNGSQASNPNPSYETDVAAVRAVISPLVDAGNNVLMLMHSYGGAVGTSAVSGLARTDRAAQGLPGGVVHLFYLSAYLLAKNQSVWDVVEKSGLAQQIAPLVTIDEDNGTWMINDPVAVLYHDLDPEDIEEQGRLVVPHVMAAVHGKVSYEGWRFVGCTYVRTAADRCVPGVYQDVCVGNAVGAGVGLVVEVLGCGHSAYAKCPGAVADLVVKAVGSG